MTKTSISLQDLRRKIYLKAKADKAWWFWGLYVHVCKIETLQTAYNDAKENNGAPGIDGVMFEDIEKAGVEVFLKQIRDELVSETYRPMRNWIKEIPKGKDKVRILGIPTVFSYYTSCSVVSEFFNIPFNFLNLSGLKNFLTKLFFFFRIKYNPIWSFAIYPSHVKKPLCYPVVNDMITDSEFFGKLFNSKLFWSL